MERLKKIAAWFEAHRSILEPIGKVLGYLAGFAVVVWLVLVPKIKETATEAATSPDTLNKIAKMLRPYCVVKTSLNSEGIFEYDSGARDILDSANLRKVGTNNDVILLLHFKQYVVTAPIVRSLTPELTVQTSWRTNKYDWAYSVSLTGLELGIDVISSAGSDNNINPNKQFTFSVDGIVPER